MGARGKRHETRRARRASAAVVVGLVVCGSLASAAASTDDDQALPARSATDETAIPNRLPKAERQSLNARFAEVLARELGLLEALDQLDRDVEATTVDIARLGLQRAQATERLHAAEASRKEAEERLGEMRSAVRARLRALLRLGRMPGLQFFWSAKDFGRSVAEDHLLRRLIAGDRERLARYRAQLERLEAVTGDRNTALQQLKDLDTKLHAEQQRLERERHDKQGLLVQIGSDPVYNERARRDLEAAHRALTERIETLKEWRERKYSFSLTRGKLMRPVSYAPVEVGYGMVRHPRFGTVTMHHGLDFVPNVNGRLAVRAIFWARVAFAGWLPGYGETVILDHGRGWHSVYAHLSGIRVRTEDVVRGRERIANVGSTGSIKGRHLYFEIRYNGKPVDPSEWFR